ncbi:MAG: TlpA family protein disulfide reductase [Candidatus Bathyarchaeia archaeon]
MGRHERQRRKPLKVEKKSSKKRTIEPERRRESILGLLIFLGVIIIAIAGGWYLLQPSGEGRQPSSEEHQITIFTISNLSPTNSSADEHPGTLAPDFSLTDPNGTSSWLSDFRGKVVVIDFMSTTCPPCRVSMPELKAVWNEHEERIVMMSISISAPPVFDDTEEMLRDWISQWEATWIHAKDATGVSIVYGVYEIPTVVIIDKDGYIRFRHAGIPPLGTISAETISQEIEELL